MSKRKQYSIHFKYNIIKEVDIGLLNNQELCKIHNMDDHKNPTATLQCKDMNFKYTAHARNIVCYRLVTFSDELCI